MHIKPQKILEQLKLLMPVALTLEDPISKQPITVAYENLHALLIIDLNSLPFEAQVVAALYAEMARFQRAAEYAAGRAEVRYRKWKAAKGDELRAARKTAKEKPPTAAQVEAYYRDHADYEKMSEEPERMKAIAGLFDDLKWSFRMKSQMMSDVTRSLSGYESAARAEESASSAHTRLADYTSLAEEASRIASESGSSEAMAELLSGSKKAEPEEPKRTARSVE